MRWHDIEMNSVGIHEPKSLELRYIGREVVSIAPESTGTAPYRNKPRFLQIVHG